MLPESISLLVVLLVPSVIAGMIAGFLTGQLIQRVVTHHNELRLADLLIGFSATLLGDLSPMFLISYSHRVTAPLPALFDTLTRNAFWAGIIASIASVAIFNGIQTYRRRRTSSGRSV